MAHLGFTPARQQDLFNIETRAQSTSHGSRTLGGEEARLFYENLLKGEQRLDAGIQTQNIRERRGRRKRRVEDAEVPQGQTQPVVAGRTGGEDVGGQRREETRNSERLTELQGLRLLRCAHHGDVPGLKDLLAKGADINFQDTFFWTALMCASWCGHRAAVKLLLQRGAAWVGVVDTQGRDARDLAAEAGHSGVLEELESYGRSPQRQCENSAARPQWCGVCSSEYSGSPSSHLTSTVHQFSLRRPPPAPHYCLPPSANSYKMMLRSGWKPGTGLGPEGGGTQRPVPTVLKRDQMGLGYGREKKRAKVTHFGAGDPDAVKAPPRESRQRGKKGTTKEESRRKEQRDKNWERDFRASFYL